MEVAMGRKENETKTEKTDVEELFGLYKRNLGEGGFVIIDQMKRPFTLVDKVSIEMSYAQYKASERLRGAIERFDESSTKLARWMLVLTVIMTFVVVTQVVLMLTT